MMKKKKQAQPLANAKVRAMAAMMDTDSDASYGSEGGLKEKPVPIKKRGGRKRTKKKTQADAGDSAERDSGEVSESTDMGELQGGTGGALANDDLDEPRGRERPERGRRPAE